ncbi:hypothetical protein SY88_14145 [Clostridiales bacterium PH28_bin88]|nr:hypothetical protein SY88_14145 [Clostridiales bacterium PH28_bin88]
MRSLRPVSPVPCWKPGRRVSGNTRTTSTTIVFSGAPVAVLFFIHKDLATGSWVDYGMFIQNVMLAARALGLET